MHISFFPTLGSCTRIPVGSPINSFKRDADGVRAAFTARLSHQDYAEVVETGLRIEVWTNAPSGPRPAGAWGPITFEEEVMEETDAQDAVDSEFSLALDTDGPSSVVEEHVFRAALTLPRNPGAVFEFTYRLVYPGGVCWLGSDRDNGVLELDASNAFFEESYDAWDTRGDRRVFVGSLPGEHDAEQSLDSSGSAVVGVLNMFEWTWTGWGTDGSRVWPLSNNYLEFIQEARLAILIPNSPGDSFILPQIHVFCATSGEAPFSVTSQGQILLQSSRQGAEIQYWLHDGNSEAGCADLRDAILSSCSAPYLFPSNTTDMIIFAPAYDTDTSVTIHAQSLTRSQSAHRSTSFPLAALDSFAKNSTVLSLFSPETRSTYFVDRSDNPGDITLRVGESGAQLVVSAVYDLVDDSKKSSKWKLSLPEITAEPKRITAADILKNPLPTPPASPQAKPLRTVSFVLPIETETETERGLRQRKPTESSTSTSQNSSLARRLVRSESAFERFQTASGGEKIRVVIVNMFKLLARFMGIAILRFILFALRLVGRQPDVRAGVNSDDSSDAPSVTRDDSKPEEEAAESGVRSSSGVEDTVGTRLLHNWSTISTEPSESDLDHTHQQERSIGHTPVLKSVSPALKWVLPGEGTTPIRLLVRSDVAPENIIEHLCIQLNGEDVATKGWSAVHGVGDNTYAIEYRDDVFGLMTCLVHDANGLHTIISFGPSWTLIKEAVLNSFNSHIFPSACPLPVPYPAYNFVLSLTAQRPLSIQAFFLCLKVETEMNDPIESAKRRYSRELAAYTFEQFRLARSAREAAQASTAESTAESPTGSNSSSGSGRSEADEQRHSRSTETQVEHHRERERNLRTVDFAQGAPLVNGTA